MKFKGPTAEQPAAGFWRMVDLAREDPDAFDAAIAELGKAEMVELYWTYRDATEPLREPEYLDRVSHDLSEDGIDDLVTWIVAQGEAYYRRILAEPGLMPIDLGDRNDCNDVQGALEEEYDRRYGDVLPFPEDLDS